MYDLKSAIFFLYLLSNFFISIMSSMLSFTGVMLVLKFGTCLCPLTYFSKHSLYFPLCHSKIRHVRPNLLKKIHKEGKTQKINCRGSPLKLYYLSENFQTKVYKGKYSLSHRAFPVTKQQSSFLIYHIRKENIEFLKESISPLLQQLSTAN